MKLPQVGVFKCVYIRQINIQMTGDVFMNKHCLTAHKFTSSFYEYSTADKSKIKYK